MTETIPSEKFSVQLDAMDSNVNPFIIKEPEFMCRIREMQQSGGGGSMFEMSTSEY